MMEVLSIFLYPEKDGVEMRILHTQGAVQLFLPWVGIDSLVKVLNEIWAEKHPQEMWDPALKQAVSDALNR
jgi:hypothetical protein